MIASAPVGVQVIGFGPAALGVAVAADRLGFLGPLLDAGIVFLERVPARESAARRRFAWRISSNSSGRDFLAGIAPEGAFATVLRAPAATAIRAANDRPVWLPLVSRFLQDLSVRIEATLSVHRRCRVAYGASVARVVVGNGGLFTSYDDDGIPLVTSRSLVVATGARERVEVTRALAPPGAVVLESSHVLAGHLGAITTALAAGAPVVVVGSSHSAFGAADLILRKVGAKLSAGQLCIACKRDVALYHASVAEARTAGFEPAPGSICAERGEVHRFDGLRGRAKDLYLRLRAQHEKRALLVPMLERPTSFTSDAVFISALGHVPVTPTLHAANGAELAMPLDASPRVAEGLRLLTRAGTALPGAYAIGLGYARPDTAGRAQVGVNLFHGPDGAMIVRSLMDRERGHPTRGEDSPEEPRNMHALDGR